MSPYLPEISIHNLDSADKELILKIARWYYDEWQTPLDRTIQRLTHQPDKDVLFQLVLSLDGQPVATGGLCHEVNILNFHEHLNAFKPWVALLYTDKYYRNQGLGKLLLKEIERCAKTIKLSRIYLYTFTAESLYLRCGWTPIDRVWYKGHDTVIMKKDI